jgi:hypothetical protein
MKAGGKIYVSILFPIILLAGFLFPIPSFAQDGGESSFSGVVPEILIRPFRFTEWAYPVDAVIGQLGAGEVSAGANTYARGVLRELMRQNKTADVLKTLSPGVLDEAMSKLAEVTPRKVRMGGGREETDGSLSFLFRFMGSENELSGELYIRADGDSWKPEDIIFEEPKKLSSGSDAFTFTYTPYERFY